MFTLLRSFFALLGLLFTCNSFAILHLTLNQGVNSAVPIAVVPFFGSPAAQQISQVMTNDLQNSGQFSNAVANDPAHQPSTAAGVQVPYWRAQNVNYVIVGNVQTDAQGVQQLQVSLLDVYKNNNAQSAVVLQQQFAMPTDQVRGLAHQISNLLYQQILGVRGAFASKIAYVLAQHVAGQAASYQLMTADYDGNNAVPILVSKQPIMSPAWSPDGSQLAYVSFESGMPAIYISNINTGKRRLITNFTGMNAAPAFSPDGTKLALVLSRGQSPNIYVVNLQTGALQQITHAYAINTEPAWSANGQQILFTSDRGGTPQIYQVDIASKQVRRMSFSGNYNAHPSYDPDGRSMIFLHRGLDSNQNFGIAEQTLANGKLKVLSEDNAQSPSIAPNGSMIIYTVQLAPGQSQLAMVSTDGHVHLRLPNSDGAVQSPAWSPYLPQSKNA
jgi:TolB protein